MDDSDSQPENQDDNELELDEELQRIEEMLGKLRPTEPRAAFSRRLKARLSGERRRKSRRSGAFLFDNHSTLSAVERRRRRWSRVVPVGVAALVALSGVVLLHRLANLPAVAPAPPHSESADASSSDGGAESTDRLFVEVSSERSLREIEENDIVVVDGVGPMRPVVLHYESAQCWVDPDTQTVRYTHTVRPRQRVRHRLLQLVHRRHYYTDLHRRDACSMSKYYRYSSPHQS